MKASATSLYDLHLHTWWSFDGEIDVESHFRRAQERGVRCLAVTEHNHMDSVAEVLAVAERYPAIRVIPSAELTVRTSIGGVDLLCYNLPVPATPGLKALFETYRVCQRDLGEQFSKGMQAIGVDFNEKRRREVLELYRPSQMIERQGLTRPKRAMTLTYFLKQGWVQDADEFDSLCARAHEAVSGLTFPEVNRVRDVVHEAGGLIVLAHPPLYCKDADHDQLDLLRTECALDGIECAHPRVTPDLCRRYRAYCVEYGLFSTGGSDSHTQTNVDHAFGRHGGEAGWLDELLDRLGESRNTDSRQHNCPTAPHATRS
ncbi:PHP domain-containing protein [Phycisphaerales bacterium AB-hyl4]|uniref:PHP domain-containing protein n=1 Tax=Natronomicrosphaera hydrolytica TaxID=3242702 RepID=A0ABV4U5S0_9BACT